LTNIGDLTDELGEQIDVLLAAYRETLYMAPEPVEEAEQEVEPEEIAAAPAPAATYLDPGRAPSDAGRAISPPGSPLTPGTAEYAAAHPVIPKAPVNPMGVEHVWEEGDDPAYRNNGPYKVFG
jgi:hypothetical protein